MITVMMLMFLIQATPVVYAIGDGNVDGGGGDLGGGTGSNFWNPGDEGSELPL